MVAKRFTIFVPFVRRTRANGHNAQVSGETIHCGNKSERTGDRRKFSQVQVFFFVCGKIFVVSLTSGLPLLRYFYSSHHSDRCHRIKSIRQASELHIHSFGDGVPEACAVCILPVLNPLTLALWRLTDHRFIFAFRTRKHDWQVAVIVSEIDVNLFICCLGHTCFGEASTIGVSRVR